MNPESVLEKTAKGVEEIETRKHKLDAKLRPILIAVNGKLKSSELAGKFASLGDPNALLDDLLKQGFVRAATGTPAPAAGGGAADPARLKKAISERSEEHTSELQSQSNLVCRLLLEKKKYTVKNCHM